MSTQTPLFWYRPVCNGEMYEGPVHHDSVGGKMLRDEKPGEWVPLYAESPESGDVAALRARQDELLEALRKALNALPRYSFFTSQGLGVLRASDRYGSWIEWSEVHSLLDPVVADELLAKEHTIAKAEGSAA